jgi:hypothetical protein
MLLGIAQISTVQSTRGLLTTGHPPFLRPVVVGGGRGMACGLRRRGRGPDVARRRPCGAVRRSYACAGRLPRAAARCGLRLVAGGGGWCWCGAAAHAARSVAACNRGPPSSTSASMSGLSRLCLRVVGWVGFLLGRDRWGGERIVGGVLPHINTGTDV